MTAFVRRSISFVRSFVRSSIRSFVRSFVRSFDFVTGGNVLLQHFSRRVLYRWLYSLWKSVIYVLMSHFSRHVLYRWLCSLWKSVVQPAIIRSFSLTVNASLFAYRWQQVTTAQARTVGRLAGASQRIG